MAIFDTLKRVLEKSMEEINKPESYVKGEAFESYVRDILFPKEMYDLIHKTHDFNGNKNDYVETSLLPDLKLRDKKTGKEFYVECKFRNGFLNKEDKIVWCNDKQLERYQRVHKNDAPVFIALGFGDKGSKPTDVCLFSLNQGKWTGLFPSFLDKYALTNEKAILSPYLWKL